MFWVQLKQSLNPKRHGSIQFILDVPKPKYFTQSLNSYETKLNNSRAKNTSVSQFGLNPSPILQSEPKWPQFLAKINGYRFLVSTRIVLAVPQTRRQMRMQNRTSQTMNSQEASYEYGNIIYNFPETEIPKIIHPYI